MKKNKRLGDREILWLYIYALLFNSLEICNLTGGKIFLKNLEKRQGEGRLNGESER